MAARVWFAHARFYTMEMDFHTSLLHAVKTRKRGNRLCPSQALILCSLNVVSAGTGHPSLAFRTVDDRSPFVVAAFIRGSALASDRRYPFGYDAYEALYVTFRSLVLLGIMVFAAFGAIREIIAYAMGEAVPEPNFGPILVYSVVMVAICLTLAAWHKHNWKRSGRRSEILSTESRASVVDAVISGGVGGGFSGVDVSARHEPGRDRAHLGFFPYSTCRRVCRLG